MDGNPGTGKTTTLCKIFKIRPLMDGNEDTKKDYEIKLIFQVMFKYWIPQNIIKN